MVGGSILGVIFSAAIEVPRRKVIGRKKPTRYDQVGVELEVTLQLRKPHPQNLQPIRIGREGDRVFARS